MDLFATRHNYKLPIFVSPVSDPLAYAMDALSTEWEDTFVYACPPTPLLPKILLELQASVNYKMILVAPY